MRGTLKKEMRIGSFDRVMEIYTQTRTRSGAHITEAYTLAKTTRCAVEFIEYPREIGVARKETSIEQRRFVIRYYSYPGLSHEMRVKVDGLMYDVEGVNVVGRNRYIRVDVKIVR